MPQTDPTTTARRFVIERGDARILDGVAWPDGSCSLRWRLAPRSFVSWDTLAECIAINVTGVPATRLVWIDHENDAQAPARRTCCDSTEDVGHAFNCRTMLGSAGITLGRTRVELPDDALPDADERARQRGLGPQA